MTSRTLFLLSVLALLAVTVNAQQRASAYLHTDDMPNAINYLPPPPDSTSAQFAYDMSQYYWGKSVRDTERGRIALEDASCSTAHLLEIYSPFMGVRMSKEKTPAIYRMMANALATGSKGVSRCKEYYQRVRPFQRYGEEVASGETLRQTSYPSGHTNRGWLAALLLVEVNPAAQDAILQRGYEYGQSRVIVGAHWQSDVDAARVVASACYARLHTDSTFLADMAAARAEYARLAVPVKDHARGSRDTTIGHLDLDTEGLPEPEPRSAKESPLEP
ncbi:MAG: phosphatase PAP2 family protein [Muribaculaceae bacterium]|nr:phosphatase PAP2 family protein [Muribaculaceae bacterium]